MAVEFLDNEARITKTTVGMVVSRFNAALETFCTPPTRTDLFQAFEEAKVKPSIYYDYGWHESAGKFYLKDSSKEVQLNRIAGIIDNDATYVLVVDKTEIRLTPEQVTALIEERYE